MEKLSESSPAVNVTTTTPHEIHQSTPPVLYGLIGFLFICVIALALSLFWLWRQTSLQNQQLQSEITTQLANHQKEFNASLSTFRQNLQEQIETTWQPKWQQQQQVIKQMQRDLNQLQAPLSAQAQWQKLQLIRFKLTIAEQYLITGLVNLPRTLQWVNTAESELSALNAPELVEAQEALIVLKQHIETLQPYHLALLNAQITQLMPLIAQITNEKTNEPKISDSKDETTPTHTAATSQAQSWYQRYRKIIEDTFNQLIVVRHQDQSILPTSLKDEQLLHTELKLSLLQAQSALLQQNQSLYQQSLEQAAQLLQTRVNAQPLRAKILDQIKTLKAVNLNPELPSFKPVLSTIDATLNSLQNTAYSTRNETSPPLSVKPLPKTSPQLKTNELAPTNPSQKSEPVKPPLKNPSPSPQKNMGVEI